MIELEKKWLLKELPVLTEYGFTLVKTETFLQTYLNNNERLRAIAVMNEPDEYQYFKKTSIGEGAAVEDQRNLTMSEYKELFAQGVSDVVKGRITYLDPETNFKYELDLLKFKYPRVDIMVLEIEFQDKYENMKEVDDSFTLPYFMEKYVLLDVTGNPKFSNYSLSIKRD